MARSLDLGGSERQAAEIYTREIAARRFASLYERLLSPGPS